MQQQRPAAADKTSASHHHQQLFDAELGEIVDEARPRGTARELGVDVRTRPDDNHRAETPARRGIRDLVARDVSTMNAAELALHTARLRALRAAVVRKLQQREEEEKKAAAGFERAVKRAPPEEQQETLAGCCGSKIEKQGRS